MDNDFEKSFEKKEREVPLGQDFAESFKKGVPEFKGNIGGEEKADKFGVAKAENNYYGETVKDENTSNISDNKDSNVHEEYDKGITGAAALINYGLNAAAREIGVETVVQKLKDFDTSGREDPVGDFFEYLGIDTPEERKEISDESEAARANESAFREGVNDPGQSHSTEGAFQAIAEMKNLIGRVEGADAAFEDIREKASAAGEGYFRTAIKDHDVQGLTELFGELALRQEEAGVKDDGDDVAVEEIATTDVELPNKDENSDIKEMGDAESDNNEKKIKDETKADVLDSKHENKDDREVERERLNPDILKKNV